MEEIDKRMATDAAAAFYLSIVIPAYGEESYRQHVASIFVYLTQQTYTAEIIVVDDGSHDATSQIVAPLCGKVPPVHLLQNGRNRGKGLSVRHGFLHACGLLTPIEEVEKLFVALSEPCDIAIASRMLSGSRVEVYQPWYRENMERLFNVLVRVLPVVPRVSSPGCEISLCSAERALNCL